ncbi:murein transglycosylase [Solihabitans fulvus]|uniref:Murein transglycosylase n=1 Tax=Solihabitans fulvus TaxID=1892852 RepID=A0A5B2WXP7_9PSEU|nr:murein transglycosylase [Solihabitans fulvus]
MLGRLLLVLVLLAVGAGGAWVLSVAMRPASHPASGPPAFLIDPQKPEPGSAIPGAAGQVPAAQPQGTPAAQPDSAGRDPLRVWADKIAQITQVPSRALRAYGNADLVMRTKVPGCQISWATLAGIGRIESHHGRYGGATLGEDGLPSKPIIGPALDGTNGFRAIPATDGGKLHGDPVWDHAVGPMQFLPSTWKQYGLRASGDGVAPDPQNIDDAALTAANYLCSGGRNLATGEGWWAAVMTYNNSVEYGQQVFSGADAYAKASVGK